MLWLSLCVDQEWALASFCRRKAVSFIDALLVLGAECALVRASVRDNYRDLVQDPDAYNSTISNQFTNGMAV